MKQRRQRVVIATPHNPGYHWCGQLFKVGEISERTLEMVKTVAVLAFASWMTFCVMVIVFSREIAQFIVESGIL